MYMLFFLQEVARVEVTDFITDSFAGELGIVLVIERLISRFQNWMKNRDSERQIQREDAAKKIAKEKEDNRIDAIDRKLAKIEGRQDAFAEMLKKH